MKKIILILLVLFSAAITEAQQVNAIATRCPYPYRIYYSSVRADATGNIIYTPCPTNGNVFTGTTFNLTGVDILLSASNTASMQNTSGQTRFSIDAATNNAFMVAGNQASITASSIVSNSGGATDLTSTGNLTLRNGFSSGASFGSNGTTSIGDLATNTAKLTITANSAVLYGLNLTQLGTAPGAVNITSNTDTLTTSLSIWNLNNGGLGPTTINYVRTNTAAGTTGAQTINQSRGSVNFAAGTAALTVTNSTVTATSNIFATANTNDATCSVKNAVPGAGSFVINMTANCTAETRVSFHVDN